MGGGLRAVGPGLILSTLRTSAPLRLACRSAPAECGRSGFTAMQHRDRDHSGEAAGRLGRVAVPFGLMRTGICTFHPVIWVHRAATRLQY
jgi:hypothetical protein